MCFTGDPFLCDDEVRFDFDQMLAHMLNEFLFHLQDASKVFLTGYFDVSLQQKEAKASG